MSKEQILKTIEELPMFSTSAMQLLGATCSPDHDLSDIINIINCDAGLTVAVLRIVNSPAYLRQTEISSIDRAVSQLGEAVVTGIALSHAAAKQYNSDLEGYDGERGELWSHCLMTGVAAKKLARYASEISAGTAFTCGLLHDLGKSVTSRALEGSPTRIIEQIEQNKISQYSTGENALLGLDHAEAGYELANHWKLPAPIPETIRFHHKPDSSPSTIKPLAYIIHLADILAMMSGSGTGADAMRYTLDQKYVEWIAVSEDDIPILLLEIIDDFSDISQNITL